VTCLCGGGLLTRADQSTFLVIHPYFESEILSRRECGAERTGEQQDISRICSNASEREEDGKPD